MKRSTQIAALVALLATMMLGGLQVATASENDATDLAMAKIEQKHAAVATEKISDDKAAKVEFDEEHGNPHSKSRS